MVVSSVLLHPSAISLHVKSALVGSFALASLFYLNNLIYYSICDYFKNIKFYDILREILKIK